MKTNFVSAPFQMSADVADDGTFTVNYPTGYNKGDFENALGSHAVINGSKLVQGKDIGLSFGASSVTITNRTGGTIPASKGVFQFERSAGKSSQSAFINRGQVDSIHTSDAVIQLIDLGAPIAASANSIALSQSVTASVAATLNGALVSNSVGILDVPRNIVAAWTGAAVLTLVLEDEYGQRFVEKSGSGTSFTGKKAAKKVISATFSANVTAATIGHGDVLGLPCRITDQAQILAEIIDGSYNLRRSGRVLRIPFQLTEAEVDASGSFFVPTGFAGKIVGAGLVVENTVTTGGNVTFEINNTVVAGLTLTVADGATAGTMVTDGAVTGDGTEVFTAAQPIEIVVPAAFNASAPVNGYIDVVATDGALVAALARDTEPSATNADIRGTYDPSSSCDGDVSIQLLVMLTEVDVGGLQYTE